jgi:hypothetical protein
LRIDLCRVTQNYWLIRSGDVPVSYASYDFEKITSAEVSPGLRNEQIHLIDAYLEGEYLAGQLSGEISLSVDTIHRKFNEILLGKTVVTSAGVKYMGTQTMHHFSFNL